MTQRTDSALSPVSPASPVIDAPRSELLQSVVDVARAIFGAEASSVFLLDEEADELVFQAVSGQGEEFLVGRRFPAGRGIAGWVATSGEPMVVDDLSADPSFDRSLAEPTAYVPIAGTAAARKRSAEKRSGGKWSSPSSITTKFTPQSAATSTARAIWRGRMRRAFSRMTV
ncbi:hypothetical protein SBADM41S_01397 [Streptomyces badius]